MHTDKVRLDTVAFQELVRSYAQEAKIRKIGEIIENLKSSSDKLAFVVQGEDYKRYCKWKLDIETRINRQELETGKRAIDGETLCENELKEIEASLSRNESRVFYGCYGFHVFGGHDYRFHMNDLTYSITVVNKLTKDEIDLGGSYFFTFSAFYQHKKSLFPEIKPSMFDRIIQKFLVKSKTDDCSRDFEIYDKWIEMTEYSRNSEMDSDYNKIRFIINPEQYKKFEEWKKENDVGECYFCFQEVTMASLDSAVDKLTGKSIDLTEVDDW
jgi:hypothetical protein